ncbi:MAG TPA: cytochrome P450 [Allosphingosinicella sp.]
MFDFASVAATHPPFAAFDQLRSSGPVVFLTRHGVWIAVSHDAVREALEASHIFSSTPQNTIDPVLLGADQPGHGIIRRLLATYLTRARLADIGSQATTDARDLIRPQFDLVADFAAPLARRAAARLVGLGERQIGLVLDGDDLNLPPDRIGEQSRDTLASARLFAWIVSAQGAAIGEAAALSLVRLMCRAAAETTERLIVRSAWSLLGEQSLHAALRESPAGLAPFVDEVARLYPPEPNVLRRTVRPVSLGGVELPGGTTIFLSLLAANRDPSTFHNPAELRLDRERTAHLAFSAGPHHCLGAGIGRQLTLVALRELLARSAAPGESAELAVVQGIATPTRLIVWT